MALFTAHLDPSGQTPLHSLSHSDALKKDGLTDRHMHGTDDTREGTEGRASENVKAYAYAAGWFYKRSVTSPSTLWARSLIGVKAGRDDEVC